MYMRTNLLKFSGFGKANFPKFHIRSEPWTVCAWEQAACESERSRITRCKKRLVASRGTDLHRR